MQIKNDAELVEEFTQLKGNSEEKKIKIEKAQLIFSC